MLWSEGERTDVEGNTKEILGLRDRIVSVLDWRRKNWCRRKRLWRLCEL